MPLIELTMTICSILHGASCRTETLTYMAESVTPFACMRYGQPEIAKWAETHPNWSVAKWRCGPAREVAKI